MQYVLQGFGVEGFVRLNENLSCLLYIKVSNQKSTLVATLPISLDAF